MVSVCMATFNGEKFIKEQIDSILCQLSDYDELIVSDDGSTDKTVDIIKSYNDRRISIFNHVRNFETNSLTSIVSSNFENAIKHAKGDYIFLSDQDDVWLPNKISEGVQSLRSSDVVLLNASAVDADLQIIIPDFFFQLHTKSGFIYNLYRNTYIGCCVCFRRKWLPLILPFPKKLPIYQGGWIYAIIELKGKICINKTITMLFRRHGNNTSSTAKESPFSFLQQLTNRMLFLCLVLKRLIFKY